MANLPTLEAALKLADQDSPLPSLAGPALKVLRDHVQAMSRALPQPLSAVALNKLEHLRRRGAREFGVAVTTDHDCMVACVSPLGRVEWFNCRRDRVRRGNEDSATLTALIAELRGREARGRGTYGTDVDRTDLNNAQWRQHLREELMDALLYSLAEERTAPAWTDFARLSPEGKSAWSALWGDYLDRVNAPGCWCETCNPVLAAVSMVLCPTCGNKRCPHAHDHSNACTGSNTVGQPGSSWGHVKPTTPPAPEDC